MEATYTLALPHAQIEPIGKDVASQEERDMSCGLYRDQPSPAHEVDHVLSAAPKYLRCLGSAVYDLVQEVGNITCR